LKVPVNISITLVADGKPLAGVPVNLTFIMAQKNNHNFVFGPSDTSGNIRITHDEIRREARKTMELFLMDYADIDAHWTGRLQAKPMNKEAIKGAHSAYRQFGSDQFPAGYEQMLLAAAAILSKIPTAKLEVGVQCEPQNTFTVELLPVQSE
jgi:hypothetical protein